MRSLFWPTFQWKKNKKNIYAHGYIYVYGFEQAAMGNPTVTRELIKQAKERYKREKQIDTGIFFAILAIVLLFILLLTILI